MDSGDESSAGHEGEWDLLLVEHTDDGGYDGDGKKKDGCVEERKRERTEIGGYQGLKVGGDEIENKE